MPAQPAVLAATGPFLTFSLEEVFELAADAGFDGVEVMVTGDRVSQDPDRIMELSRRYELPVPVIHGPFLLLTRRVFGTEPRAKVDRSIALAAAAGATTLVIHPPYAWQSSYAAWLCERIDSAARDDGVLVAVETMYPVWVGERALRSFRWSEPEDFLDCPYVTLDTSHMAVARRDPLAVFAQLGRRVVHLHVSNNAGFGRDDHASLTEGVLDLGALLERVGRSDPPPTVTLELDVRTWEDDRGALLEALRDNVRVARAHLTAGAVS